jgi:hypothetical protein
LFFCQAGILGAQNADAAHFLLMERVGPGANHNMALGAVLLADKEYRDKEIAFCYSDSFSHGPNNANIMVIPDQERAPTFNRRLSRCRVLLTIPLNI